jgi:hypothetical protein
MSMTHDQDALDINTIRCQSGFRQQTHEALLQESHDIDEHFRQAPFDRNIPVKRRRAASRGTR